jgi:hypothetical protein
VDRDVKIISKNWIGVFKESRNLKEWMRPSLLQAASNGEDVVVIAFSC